MKIKKNMKAFFEKTSMFLKIKIKYNLIKFKIKNLKLNKWRFKTVKIKANQI